MEDTKIISTCSLTKEQVVVERNSPFSFTQKATYATVNTCSGVEVGRYDVKELTGFGSIVILVGVIIVVAVVGGLISAWVNGDF